MNPDIQRFMNYVEDANFMFEAIQEFINDVDSVLTEEAWEAHKSTIILERQRLEEGARLYLKLLQEAQVSGCFLHVKLPDRMKAYVSHHISTDIDFKWMAVHMTLNSKGTQARNREYIRENLRDCAAQGHMYAQFDLAALENAPRWYLEAANQGHPRAQNNLGRMYELGTQGVDRDYKQAKQFYELAVAQGDSSAQNNLGYLLQHGHRCELREVEHFFELSLTPGSRPDLECMSEAKQDHKEARRLFELSADDGNTAAQINLGVMVQMGHGGIQDYRKAKQLYDRAAGNGNTSAYNNLGYLYAHGLGVDVDYQEARRCYESAAAFDNTAAQNNLGCLYYQGQGVKCDYKEAKRFFELAAEKGNASAQFNLGSMYENGHGVDRDYKVAIRWYELAAQQNDSTAQTNLGHLYRMGLGVEKNIDEAKRWYTIAAAQGNDTAKWNLEDLFKEY